MSEVRLRDFSRASKELRFVADGEEYVCKPALSPDLLSDLMALTKKFSGENPDFKVIKDVFELVMTDESAARIHTRLVAESENPLGWAQILDIIQWLVEIYTQRPTQPSSAS